MFKGIQQFLFYKTSMGENAAVVKTQIMEDNRRFAIIWSSVQLIYWAYCMIMSIKAPDFMMCRSIYIAAFSVCAVSFVLAIFVAPKAPRLTRPVCIAVDSALLGAGIFIARLLAPKTIIIFASVLLVPVFFICDTLSTLILFAVNSAAFVIIGVNGMEPETFRWTLTNMLIFSSIGLILGYFVNRARFERYSYAISAEMLAESNAKLAELQTNYANYDQMTGLLNRRAYAEKIDRLAEQMPFECCVVMADINGLKEMNDTRGHEAGDELIIGTAECLKQSFRETDLIYRIGGDEFCVIMSSMTDGVEECLHQLDKAGRLWKGKIVNGISVSCGYASNREFGDFDSMLKAADRRMYSSKNDYYKRIGKEKNYM